MNNQQPQNQERRSFLKWSLLGGALVASTVKSYASDLTGRNNELQINELMDGAVVGTDCSFGGHCRLTVTQNFLLANPINGVDGQRMLWEIIQDDAGGHSMEIDHKFSFGHDLRRVYLSSTPNKRDFLTAIYNAKVDKWFVVAFVKGY